VDTSQVAALLRHTPLFAGLDDDTLAMVAGEAHVRSFAKGSLIFYQGEPGEAFYVITSGTVKVFVTSGHGDEMVLVTLRPPDTLGEVALLDGGERSASAEALEDVTTLAFSRNSFLDLIATEPAIADGLLRTAGSLLRRLTGQASDLVFLDLEGRVAKLLVTMAEERGEATDDGISLDLGLTQRDLASMVGGSRQSVNQILHALEGRGLVRVDHGRTVTITQPDALRHRAGVS
jgi:CRP/FNR family cyclic AMP-dependent transcriptional regulator